MELIKTGSDGRRAYVGGSDLITALDPVGSTMSARVVAYAGAPGMSCGCTRPRRSVDPRRREPEEEKETAIAASGAATGAYYPPSGLRRTAYVPAGGW